MPDHLGSTLRARARLSAMLVGCTLIGASFQIKAQLDETAGYEDVRPATPLVVRATVPGWLKTGHGVTTPSDLKMDESLDNPPDRVRFDAVWVGALGPRR